MCKSIATISLPRVPFLRCLASNNGVTLTCGLEVTQGHWNWCHRKLGYGFLFSFQSNYGPILYNFRDKTRHWSKKIATFCTPAFHAPVRGLPVGILTHLLVWKNWNGVAATRRWKNWCIAVSIRHNTDMWRTDGQMNRRTDILWRHSPRLYRDHRAVKTKFCHILN